MPCTTILVGKKATHDGSTIISRNDDGSYHAKHIIVVSPKEQWKKYKCVISHLEIELPDNPLSYTACPNVDLHSGQWATCGINSANVAMTATETITSNPRVMGADPYVCYKKEEVKGRKKPKETVGGIGEEDIVSITLPYIHSAKEGAIRLGSLLEKYGTYEPNGIAFSDENEIWWLESIGGHHWIAKRVPDDAVVIMPNQFGLDNFDFEDAYSKQENNMCSKDLLDFVKENNLYLGDWKKFNPRHAFGSHSDADHVYNTPRAWFLSRYFNKKKYKWDGENADFTPESDDIPWSLIPEQKVTIQDIKYVLSSYYQTTPYNPYSKSATAGKYRSIGVPNTDCCGILQIRPNVKDELKGLEWFSFGGGAFTACIPQYTNVPKIPEYFSKTTKEVNSNYFYWISRLISVLTDMQYGTSLIFDERYQNAVLNQAHQIVHETDKLFNETNDIKTLTDANEKIAKMLRDESEKVLDLVLTNASNHMKTRYNRGDN